MEIFNELKIRYFEVKSSMEIFLKILSVLNITSKEKFKSIEDDKSIRKVSLMIIKKHKKIWVIPCYKKFRKLSDFEVTFNNHCLR